jgi:hypothetical protein
MFACVCTHMRVHICLCLLVCVSEYECIYKAISPGTCRDGLGSLYVCTRAHRHMQVYVIDTNTCTLFSSNTYTHMCPPRHFDAQLHTAIETLRAKENDLKELIQMSTDAHRAKEAAKAELARLEQTIAEERKIRQKVCHHEHLCMCMCMCMGVVERACGCVGCQE